MPNDPLFDAAEDLKGDDKAMENIAMLLVMEDSLQRSKETQEALLEDINTRLNNIRRLQLPEAMNAAGVDRFRSSETGTEARLAFECAGALGTDEEERERKIDLLIGAGADEIVKMEVSVAFGKDDYAKAQALAGELNRRGLAAACYRTIHPMTLKAWVKERMEEGATLPLEEVGLWYGQVAKIRRPKEETAE